MSKEKNKYVNEILKENFIKNNKKHYYVRTGSCNWKKCQSACCRFRHTGKIKISGKNKELSYKHQYHNDQGQEEQRICSNGYEHKLSPFLCPSITFDGKCKLHNKRSQPYVCQYFPMVPDDGVYIALKHICGYKFKKIKNTKWKKKKV